MIKGTYSIIKNGEIVCQKDNIITGNGRDMMIKFLGSSIGSWADHLAIGSYGTAATINDQVLGFEIARNVIKVRSPYITYSSGTYSSVSGQGLLLTLPSFGSATIGTVTSNTATITVTSTNGLVVGGVLTSSGTGSVGTNATITSILGPTTFTATAASGMTAGAVTTLGSSYITPGMSVSYVLTSGAYFNSVVTAVNGTASSVTATLADTPSSSVTGNPTISFNQRKVIFKTELDPSIVANIKELGLFSSSLTSDGYYSSEILTKFDEGVSASDVFQWSAGSNVTTGNDIGTASIKLTAGDLTTNPSVLGNTAAAVATSPGALNKSIVGFDKTDTLKISAYNDTGSPMTSQQIRVVLYDNQNTPGTMTFTTTATYPANSTVVSGVALSSATTTGNFNYTISSIKVTSTAALTLDAIRIDPTSKMTGNSALLSRTALSTPISKVIGDTLEVQYEIVMGL